MSQLRPGLKRHIGGRRHETLDQIDIAENNATHAAQPATAPVKMHFGKMTHHVTLPNLALV